MDIVLWDWKKGAHDQCDETFSSNYDQLFGKPVQQGEDLWYTPLQVLESKPELCFHLQP